MERIPSVIFKSRSGCVLDIMGTQAELMPGVPTLVPASGLGELVFTVFAPFGVPGVPVVHRIRFREGCPEETTLPLIDWGDAVEACAEPVLYEVFRSPAPRLVSEAQFFYKEARAKAELYVDGSLRLALAPDGGEAFSIPLGDGRDGSLKPLDMGRERVLSVLAKMESGMRLLIVDRNAEIMLDESGSLAEIKDGYPTLITSLPSVRGLESRTRYELGPGGFSKASVETGFFTHEEVRPDNDADTALSFFEELKLGFAPGWRSALSDGLESAGEGELREYLGEYSSAAVYPVEEPRGTVTVGLMEGGGMMIRPRRFTVSFKDGRITDIAEL